MESLSKILSSDPESVQPRDHGKQLEIESTRIGSVLPAGREDEKPTPREPLFLDGVQAGSKPKTTRKSKKSVQSLTDATFTPEPIDDKFSEFDTIVMLVQSSADRITHHISTITYQLALEKQRNEELERQRDEWMMIAKHFVGEHEITKGAEIETPIIIPSWTFAISFFTLGLCVASLFFVL